MFLLRTIVAVLRGGCSNWKIFQSVVVSQCIFQIWSHKMQGNKEDYWTKPIWQKSSRVREPKLGIGSLPTRKSNPVDLDGKSRTLTGSRSSSWVRRGRRRARCHKRLRLQEFWSVCLLHRWLSRDEPFFPKSGTGSWVFIHFPSFALGWASVYLLQTMLQNGHVRRSCLTCVRII